MDGAVVGVAGIAVVARLVAGTLLTAGWVGRRGVTTFVLPPLAVTVLPDGNLIALLVASERNSSTQFVVIEPTKGGGGIGIETGAADV